MPFTSAGWKAAARAWPLFVLVWVLYPVAAVHGLGGALTHGHGHGDTALTHPPAGVHAAAEHGAHGAHSFTVIAHQEGDHHRSEGAEPAEPARSAPGAPADAGSPHAHADCLSVAASAGLSSLFPLLLWPALSAGGLRPPSPPRPLAAAALRRRARSVRFRRTRLRLAELSVLRL